MENDSKKIIAIETLDKREVGKKSTNMEKAGFQRALEDVRSSNNVTEVVTDAHLQIGALMSMLNSNTRNRIITSLFKDIAINNICVLLLATYYLKQSLTLFLV